MKLSLVVISFLFSAVSFAGRYELPQPKTWGPNKVPVYFISPAVQLGKATTETIYLKSRAILKWGTDVFESGLLVYKCRPGRVKCQAFQFLPQGSFEKCLVRHEKVRCFNRLGSSDAQTEERDHHLDNPLVDQTDPDRLEIDNGEGSSVYEESPNDPFSDDHHRDNSSNPDAADDGFGPML